VFWLKRSSTTTFDVRSHAGDGAECAGAYQPPLELMLVHTRHANWSYQLSRLNGIGETLKYMVAVQPGLMRRAVLRHPPAETVRDFAPGAPKGSFTEARAYGAPPNSCEVEFGAQSSLTYFPVH